MSLNWTAKRKGTRYCSTACGHGCSFSEFLRAKSNARKLVARLKKSLGGKWTSRVWENLGWHYSVTNKELHLEVYDNGSIKPSFVGSFSSFLQISGPWGGNLVKGGTTPESAVKATLCTAKKQLRPVIADYQRLAQ